MDMSTQLQTQQAGGQVVMKPSQIMQSMLARPNVQKQFEQALGAKAGGFITSILSLYSSDAQLAQCDPGQVIACCLKAAQLDLPIDKQLGFAYVIPFNNRKTGRKDPQFIMGYKGYIQLAMRSGQYLTINTDVVYKGELTKKDKLSGMVTLDGQKESDEVIGYFGYFKLLNGFEKLFYVSVEEMAEYALRYSPSISRNTKPEALIALAGKGATGGGVGWFGDFDSMAKKTCLRQLLSKYGILSVEMQNAIINDVDEAPAGGMATREQIISAETVTDIPFDEPETHAEAVKEVSGINLPPEPQKPAQNEIRDESGVECEF